MKRRSRPQERTSSWKLAKNSLGEQISRGRFYAVSTALILLALVVRLYHLGTRQLWLDEAYSHYVATIPNWLQYLLRENNPPSYFLFLRAWIKLAGTSEFSLRLLTALAGVLFVAVVIWAGSEIFNRGIGLWSGAVAALSPIQIYYSQEARVYGLFALFLLLAMVFVWRATESNRWRDWILFGAAALMALYSHYLAPLALLPMGLLPFLRPRPGRRFRCLVVASAAFLLLLPWMVWSFVLIRRPNSGTAWIREVWNQTSKLFAIPLSLEIFGLGSEAGQVPIWMHQFADINFPVALRLLGLLLLVVFVVIVAGRRGDSALGIADVGFRKTWLAVLVLGPLLLLWLVSWGKPLYAIGRYDILAYPAFPLLIGFALGKLQRNSGGRKAALLAALFLIPVAAKVYLYYQAPETSNAKSTAEFLDSTVRGEDAVVITGLRAMPVIYYLNRLGYVWENGVCRNASTGRSFACRMYPRVIEQTPAVADPEQFPDTPGRARAELDEYLNGFDTHNGTFWILLSSPQSVTRTDQLLFRELANSGFEQVADAQAARLVMAKMRKR